MGASTAKKKKKNKARGLKSPEYYTRMAHFYSIRGDYSAAAECLRTSVRVDPENPKPAANLANLFSMMGDFDEAEKFYLKARELGDGSAATAISLVSVYQIKGNYREALELIDQVEAMKDPEVSQEEIHFARGMCHVKMEKYDEAEKVLAEMEKLQCNADLITELRETLKTDREEADKLSESRAKAKAAVKKSKKEEEKGE